MSDSDQGESRAVQRYAIGVSVESLAAAWARRDEVPGGSVVVVDSEIAGRHRLGEPWSVPAGGAVALGMVIRPDIDLDQQDLLWLVGSLAAAKAAASCSEVDLSIHWPDTLELVETRSPVGFVNVVTQLGPGRIEHSVVSLRFSLGGLGLDPERAGDLVDSAVAELDAAVVLLAQDRQGLIDAVTDEISTIGHRVKAVLLPRGEARGTASALDPRGRLVLKTSTGMLEHVGVEGLRSVEVV